MSIATIIEVWFEWSAFSNLEAFHKTHWIGGVALFSMLIAHWAYFGAGIIGIICLRGKGRFQISSLSSLIVIVPLAHVVFALDHR